MNIRLSKNELYRLEMIGEEEGLTIQEVLNKKIREHLSNMLGECDNEN